MSYPSFSILIVDDEAAWMRSLKTMLMRTSGLDNVLTCDDSRKVMDILEKNNVGLVLLDLTMPHLGGRELLERILAEYPHILVIIITGLNTVDNAVNCMKAGAFDYYVKTWGEERLSTGIAHAVRVAELQQASHRANNGLLKRGLNNPQAFDEIITANDRMRDIFQYIEAVASSRAPILITGESGVGKELIARAIHRASQAEGRFVSVNMASLDGEILEDTLFGHAKGAFTNAQVQRNGLVEEAAKGTLFLDEIGELSLPSQARLLRFFQEGEYYPLGSDKSKRSQTRIVLATNQNLEEKQAGGTFRKDLFYRLNTHHIHIPPLRERKEDIALLIPHFLRMAGEEYQRAAPAIPPELTLELTNYSYPGNVRELQGLIARAVSRAGDKLQREDFNLNPVQPPADGQQQGHTLLDLFMAMEELPSLSEIKSIMTTVAMVRSNGNQTMAAKLLGISQPALSKRLSS